MKRTIRLTESDLHRVIKESVKRILSENGVERRGVIYDYDESGNEPPFEDDMIGSDAWFRGEFNPKQTQVGRYENMSDDFVNWANMNDEENGYDETASWDNHFKKLENDASWREQEGRYNNAKRIHNASKSMPHLNKGFNPNTNVYDNRKGARDYINKK